MRKNQAEKRQITPDPVYQSVLVAKTINMVMLRGKKGLAQTIVYEAFRIVEQKTKEPGFEVFKRALDNVMPVLELRARKVAGSSYQVPTIVAKDRKQTLGLRWLIVAAKKRHEKSMILKFAAEIMDAARQTGAAVKKKDDTHRMAEANKAFAHLRY